MNFKGNAISSCCNLKKKLITHVFGKTKEDMGHKREGNDQPIPSCTNAIGIFDNKCHPWKQSNNMHAICYIKWAKQIVAYEFNGQVDIVEKKLKNIGRLFKFQDIHSIEKMRQSNQWTRNMNFFFSYFEKLALN